MISIIVPVYNVERYLPRCVESIMQQTYTEFELILVNDGSIDNSGKICDYYSEKDNRIKVIHKANGGVSEARNTGIDAAKGEYISFIDADDWIEKDYLEILFSMIKQDDVQMSLGMIDFRELRVRRIPEYGFKYIDFKNPDFEDCFEFFDGWLSYGPCVKIYLRDIIVNNNLRFPLGMKHGEDTMFVHEYLSKCNKISITNDVLYHYNRLNEGSATKKIYDEFSTWNVIICSKSENMLDTLNMSVDEKKKIMDRIVTSRIVLITSNYVKKYPVKEAINRINITISEFEKWILKEGYPEKIDDGRSAIRRAIREKNAELIYREQKEFLKKRKKKKMIKSILYKIVAPVLERKRDGLFEVNLNK